MHLFSAKSAQVLEQVAWSRVLVAFDFDGTLAPIVADRDSAHMRARTRTLLQRVADLYPCAVISGRGKRDVEERLDGAKVKYVTGNHGIEPGANMNAFEANVARVVPILSAAQSSAQGVDIEDKRYSLAVHYRKARRKKATRELIRTAVARLPIRMRIIPGKLVMNVIPEWAPDKGDALLSLRNQERADTALYVGDDETDEDVFRLDQPGRLLSVRVGRSRSSAAAYFLRDQREIDRLLSTLVGLGEKRRTG
jgi:trehalose 6-phosphate phosphatase